MLGPPSLPDSSAMRVYSDRGAKHSHDIEARDPRNLVAVGTSPSGAGCTHRIESDAADETILKFLAEECPGTTHALSLEEAEVEPIPDIPGQKEER